jgi:perosamine synthetase
MLIPHSKPQIGKDDIEAVSRVLESGHIAQGEIVKEFEDIVAQFVGVEYAVAVSSGTSAIHLALAAISLEPNDEVIIPSYVCPSLYMAVLHVNATPKIIDIGSEGFNITAESVRKGMTRKTKAIIVPHMFGTPAELDELAKLKISIIEDCAQSLGAKYRKKRVGSIGKIGICSFYATKMITCGEGGMILTDDCEIYEKAHEMREYDKRSLNTVRFNYKMTEFQAALGISQMKKLNDFIKRRKKIATLYHERFSDCDVGLPNPETHKNSVYYRFVILHNKIDWIRSEAKKKGIMCERPVWKPLHQEFADLECKNSDNVYDRTLSIPIYPALKDVEVDYIAVSMREIFKEI